VISKIEPNSGNISEFEDFVDRNHKIPKPKIYRDLCEYFFSPRKNSIEVARRNIVDEIANDSLKRLESCSIITELEASTKYKKVKTTRKYLLLINLSIEIHK
jgi:hypothetical protein